MKTTIDMAREAGIRSPDNYKLTVNHMSINQLKAFEALVRADERERAMRENAYVQAEREACAKAVEEFARKWWKIHCDSNLHYSSTLKAHQDFCALQAAIRNRGNT
jgi:hypothetical protein